MSIVNHSTLDISHTLLFVFHFLHFHYILQNILIHSLVIVDVTNGLLDTFITYILLSYYEL